MKESENYESEVCSYERKVNKNKTKRGKQWRSVAVCGGSDDHAVLLKNGFPFFQHLAA